MLALTNEKQDTVGVTDPDTQTLINGLLQIFNFAIAASAAFMVDRLGRRTLFLISCLGMLVTFIVWTACSAVFANTASHAAGIVVIVCVFVYFAFYDSAFTPLLFGYVTEIFPYSTRAKGLTVDMLSIYSSLIVLAFVNPIALDNIGWHYYIVFCVLLVFISATVYFLFPETKGHSLEEIAIIFDGPGARVDRVGAEDDVFERGVGEKGGAKAVEDDGSESNGSVEHVGKV